MPHTISKLLSDHRIILFWSLAIIGLIFPWIIPPKTTVASTTPGSGRICQIASIYDGDTMRVICDGERMKVRLNCIDAPEMGQKPWGRESRDYLRAIATPSIRVIGKKKDRYGRLIAEVWTNDDTNTQENLNLAMVHSGRAAVYPKYCKEQQYYQAQEGAQGVPSGIWEKPGDWQRPWEWRKR